MIVNWMRQGMPYGQPADPTLEAIEVHPRERVMKKGAQQQLVVLARMTDGSVEDISLLKDTSTKLINPETFKEYLL